MRLPAPNRVAAWLTALAGLAAAVSVPLANLDTRSVAGVVAGLVAIVAAYDRWLVGWRAHEERASDVEPGDPDALPHIVTASPDIVPPDQGDQGRP